MMGTVAGAVVLVVLMAVVFPPLVLGGGALLSLALGWSLREDVERRHQGSELVELNR